MKATPTLGTLPVNPHNPRQISADALAALGNSIQEFGDLSGFVFNASTGRLVGGHQRQRVLPAGARIVIERRYRRPTRTGTIAEGYVEHAGERYAYREVRWPEKRERQAMLAANQHGGEFDEVRLADVRADFSAEEIDLSGFDMAGVFTDTTGIMDKEIFAPPRMVWAFIGVPLETFGKLQKLLDRLPPGATVHTSANDTDCNAADFAPRSIAQTPHRPRFGKVGDGATCRPSPLPESR
jgi:hypothetical protein